MNGFDLEVQVFLVLLACKRGTRRCWSRGWGRDTLLGPEGSGHTLWGVTGLLWPLSLKDDCLRLAGWVGGFVV